MIRNHSHYSLLMATSKPDEIVKKAKELGSTYVGLTDYVGVAGVVDFVKSCRSEDLKPIIGCEIQLEKGTIVLLCRNKKGWDQLVQVISKSNSKENYVDGPQISFDQLISIITPDNFVCIDGYLGSQLYYQVYTDTDFLVLDKDLLQRETDISPYLERMSVFTHYFLETFSEDCESYPLLCSLSNKLQSFPNTIPFSGTNYIEKEDSIDHRILLCSKLKTTMRNLERQASTDAPSLVRFLHSSCFYMKTSDCSRVADLCETFNILSKPRLPHFECPNGQSEIEYLKELCRQGWKQKLIPAGKVDTKEKSDLYRDRVLRELEIAEMASLAGYFLIVQDYVNKVKKDGKLVGCGRGSAGGSLVSYLLNITEVDPIEYDLLFDRFYNASRSYPDHISFAEKPYVDFVCEKLS